MPGWTWEYVEDYMTVPRYNALAKYWRERCPPASSSLAAFIGFKPAKTADQPNTENDDRAVEEVLAMFPMRPKAAV